MPEAAPDTTRSSSDAAPLPGAAVVLVAGLAMPPHAGLLLPLLLALLMVVVGERRLRLVARARGALAARWLARLGDSGSRSEE